jgi:hypothetical protein
MTAAHEDNAVRIVNADDTNGNRAAQTNTTSGAPVTPTLGMATWG